MSEEKTKIAEEETNAAEEEIVELTDDTGRVFKFYHLGTMDYKEEVFAFFQPAEQIEGAEEDEIVIFQVKDNGEGDETLLPVTDQEKLDAVFNEFCNLMDEQESCGGNCAFCSENCENKEEK